MESGFSVMWMILLCHVLCCSIMMSYNHGMVEATETLENDEHMEIEQKLKLINKPAVKIIKSIDGERYGCVDFYKQPGLDHLSMKNHTFNYKMRLSSYPEGSNRQREKKNFGHLWENGVGCPIGTVPIRRITKDDLLRLNTFNGHNSNPRGSWNNTYGITSYYECPHHFAVVRTTKRRSYYGASMNVVIYNPPVRITQFSSARMHIQIGNEFIQAGWIVNIPLNGDGKTRLFVYTKAGGTQCFNNICSSGMILVRHDFAPGLLLTERNITIGITKDKANGNWWLLLHNSGEEVGFWPSSRFKESLGTKIEWGGEVFSPSFSTPPMGNGHFPTGNPIKDSLIRYLSIINTKYRRDETVKNTERFADEPNSYKVFHAMASFWPHLGHFLNYGGPELN